MQIILKNFIKDMLRLLVRVYGRLLFFLGLESVFSGPPQIYIHFTQCDNEPSVDIVNVFPKAQYIEPEPKSVLSSARLEHREKRSWTSLPKGCVVLRNGRTWGIASAIISENDVVIDGLTREFGHGRDTKYHSIFRQLNLGKTTKVKGAVAVLNTMGFNVYYHWMLDILPKIYLLRESGLFSTIDYFVVNETGLAFQKETLSFFGIPNDKLINIENNRKFHLQADRLIAPTLPTEMGKIASWIPGFLQKAYFPKLKKREKKLRLYISRRRAGNRKILNEEVVWSFLQFFNFQEFFPEDYTVLQQADIFYNSEIIVAPHGSALTNISFCEAGTKILDILPPQDIVTCFWSLANKIGLEYWYLLGEGKINTSGNPPVNRDIDITVNMQKLESTIKEMMRT